MTSESTPEPDPRLLLANRRTFLSWLRTSLGLVAGGVALGLVPVAMEPVSKVVAAVILIGTGGVVPIAAWIEWARVERALHAGHPIGVSRTAPAVAVVITVVAVVLLSAVLARAG